MTDPSSRGFATTQWSLVRAAGRKQSNSGRQALAELFQRYWYPLYYFLRRKGCSNVEAEDVLQGFFLQSIESDMLESADPDRGRFRTYLLTSLQNFLANDIRKMRAQKRGGSQPTFSLDFESGEERYRREPVDTLTPEQAFERQWAWTVIDQATRRLTTEWSDTNRRLLFQALQPVLAGQSLTETYREIGDRLGLSETAVKVSAHRLRSRCAELIRSEIAETVASADEVDDELARLFDVLGRG